MRVPSTQAVRGNRCGSIGSYLYEVRGNQPTRKYHLPSDGPATRFISWVKIGLWLLVSTALGVLGVVWSFILR